MFIYKPGPLPNPPLLIQYPELKEFRFILAFIGHKVLLNSLFLLAQINDKHTPM